MLQRIHTFSDYGFFCERYVGLLIDFPVQLTDESLDRTVCPKELDAQTVISALHACHSFLQEIARTFENIGSYGKKAVLDVFLCIDLLWFLGVYGHVRHNESGYSIAFEKAELTQKKTVRTAPDSFLYAFEQLSARECRISFSKQGKAVDSYRGCDSGEVCFFDPLVALGLHIYVQALINRTFSDMHFKFRKTFNPVVHCVYEYYQTDMRIFLRDEYRPPFDVDELLAGLSEDAKIKFHLIWDTMSERYPQCVPKRYGLYDYVMSGVSFEVDKKHRMLGQLTIGFDADNIGFYSAMAPEPVAELIRNQVDFAGLAKASSCGDWMNIITREGALNAVKIMDIQARHNKTAGVYR